MDRAGCISFWSMARKPKPPVLVPAQRPRARALNPDEAALFRAAMKDTRPLGPRRHPKAPYRPPRMPKALPKAIGDHPPSIEPPSTDRPRPLDRPTALRLRRGLLKLDGRIDLHGMTQAAAHRALNGFILRQRESGSRCVLVITGKGSAATGEIGVLRANLPRWLAEPPLGGLVLGAVPAQPKDGGDGAFYILLRRERSGPSRQRV